MLSWVSQRCLHLRRKKIDVGGPRRWDFEIVWRTEDCCRRPTRRDRNAATSGHRQSLNRGVLSTGTLVRFDWRSLALWDFVSTFLSREVLLKNKWLFFVLQESENPLIVQVH